MPRFLQVFLRLFAIQASWNYERMQGIGFGYAAEPALRDLEGGPDGARYGPALARQSRFFNSHPYLAGLAVGAAVRAEFDGEDPERIERLRVTLGAPLGSLGDRLIWASWLPACAAAGIVLVVLGAGAWSVLAFLALYNVAHMALRWWSLRAGWTLGMTVASAFQAPGLRIAGVLAGPVAGLAVGFMLPFAFAWQVRGAATSTIAAAAAGALVFGVLARVVAARISGAALAALVLGATWVVGLLWA